MAVSLNPGIGIFDSGIGGLTVARAITEILPEEIIVYFGDTARVPYGSKSPETILRFARQNTRFLLSQNVKLVVVACNTVSSVALENLKKEFSIPFVGVTEPGARVAAKTSQSGVIGVIGTLATTSSRTYTRLITAERNGATVLEKACPLLVPLVEEGWLDDEVTYAVLRRYLDPLLKHNIDTLVLGCTHYPLLKPAIERIVGDSVRIIDSAHETALQVKACLESKGMITKVEGRSASHSFFVSDIPARFQELGNCFFGSHLNSVIHVEIDDY